MIRPQKSERLYKGQKKVTWIVRWASNGRKPQKTFQKKKDADGFAAKLNLDLDSGQHIERSDSKTISDLCDAYMRAAEDRVRDGRIGRNRFDILGFSVNKSIAPRLGKVLALDLTAVMVEDFYRAMVREDRLAPRTAKDRIYVLREIQDEAIKRGYLKATPVSEALQALKGIKQDKIATFAPEEVATLLRSVQGHRYIKSMRTTDFLECYVNIAAFCGLRFGEIQALTLDNVNLEKRVLRVRHNLTCYDELKGPKTRAGLRDVPIAPHVARLIERWIAQWYFPNKRNLIFRTGQKGAMLGNPNFLKQLWQPLLKRAGLLNESDPFHFHALRHFCASWMIENGLPVTEVAALLGHNKFDMTLQTYAHPIMAEHRRHDAMERMASSLLMPVIPERREIDVLQGQVIEMTDR